ncbi:Putative uncharacterized protein [Taphrina deformans PYCC 5710]|uniref:Major facilitator superfamily (MFS) profile domain-containing protein n=1 Tax=Taphrina deformans (strain PYCC 5710 / ATCC 11124 / CBS 356.35 / IMI 108563 / JCM 9778 / NBRC 8474) TaxID=1097556 RepID=R4X9H6_TAPDE|nr:Putative uncharacterized protein [Taphrina deformans PYCC 5710]|eukprot:CCG82365.1 Putative uncharacterized protein [Taphrina deformans PYCC 5710]
MDETGIFKSLIISANDPLNWAQWRRDVMLIVIGFHSLVGGGQTPILAAGFRTVSEQFNVPLTKVSYTTGAYMFALGIGSVIAGPLAEIYGKRPVYLAGQIIFCAACIWAALSPSYPSLLAARIVEGFGVSPVECLPSSSIAEIFFLHERAFRLGIYTMLLLGGKNLVPLVSAAVIQTCGWRWVFGIVAIIVAMNFVLTFVFVSETSWDRNVVPAVLEKSELPSLSANVDATPFSISDDGSTRPSVGENYAGDSVPTIESSQDHMSQPHALRIPTSQRIDAKEESQPEYTVASWKQRLAVSNGRLSSVPFWKIALRPFVLFAYPAILFSTIVYSLSVVWLIVMSESLSQIFQANPYNFSSLSIGLIYISPLIGGILGSSVAGKLSDILVKSMAHRNNGIYEPEFRLVLAIPVALVTALGLIGFGWSAYVKDPWIAPTVFFGCISFGCSLGSTMSISFVVDSYRIHAQEALVTLNFTKNTLGFIFSLWFNDALTADGSRTIFIILGAVQIFVCLFALPLYIYGKRCRSWTHRSGMIDWLYR